MRSRIGGDTPRESLVKWAFRGAPNFASHYLGREEHVRLDLGLHAIETGGDRPAKAPEYSFATLQNRLLQYVAGLEWGDTSIAVVILARKDDVLASYRRNRTATWTT